LRFTFFYTSFFSDYALVEFAASYPADKIFSGAKQIRWLWGSNTLYSLDDSLAKYRLIPGNGLTNNSGTIDWGGLLTNPFTIFSGDQKAVIFSLTDNSINTVSQMLINGSAFGVTLSNTANNFAAGFAITPSRTLFGLQNNTIMINLFLLEIMHRLVILQIRLF